MNMQIFEVTDNYYDTISLRRKVVIKSKSGDLQIKTASFDDSAEQWGSLSTDELINKVLEWDYRTHMQGKFMNEAVELAEKKAKEAKEEADKLTESRKLIEELNHASTEVKDLLDTVRKEVTEFKAVFVKSTELSQEDKELLIKQFESYKTNHEYQTNDILNFEGVLYKVVQSHKSQSDWKPDKTPSLYTPYLTPKTTDGKEVVNEFKQPTGGHDAYKKGDKVMFNGNVYESLADNNVYSPTDYPKNWEKLGV